MGARKGDAISCGKLSKKRLLTTVYTTPSIKQHKLVPTRIAIEVGGTGAQLINKTGTSLSRFENQLLHRGLKL